MPPPPLSRAGLTRVLPDRARALLRGPDRRVRRTAARFRDAGFAQSLPASPVSRDWGFERGTPIDRFYIERFLEQSRERIRGAVLEFGDDAYTRRFGGARVGSSDVLDVAARSGATIVADITQPDAVPAGRFDCVICTQVLQMIFDVRAALAQLHRALAPGGALLVTGAGISKVGRRLGVDPWGEYWRFTAQSLELLLDEAFPGGEVEVTAYGNVRAATAFLYGVAAEELPEGALERRDAPYEVIVAARAVKGAP